MEFMNKMRKKTKGFTLVEIIVVLVILAILAAFTIPTMLGFVEDAKGKAYIVEAREVYVAAQASLTECIGTGQTIEPRRLDSDYVGEYKKPIPANEHPASHQMWQYLKDDLTFTSYDYNAPGNGHEHLIAGNSAWLITFDSATAKVTQVKYIKNGYEVTIKDGNASVKKL